jgi:hypothetical protein
MVMEKTIHQRIENTINELDTGNISAARRRHLEDEIENLRKYHDNHPNEDHNPNDLEMYCDSNPDAQECRIYEI